MFSQLSPYIYSILIGCIFTTTSVFAVTCSSYQQTCYNYSPFAYWCCSDDDTCGTYYGMRCISHNSSLSAGMTALIIFAVLSAVVLVSAIYGFCRARAQRRQLSPYPMNYGNTPVTLYGYQQQPIVRTTRVAPSEYPYTASVPPPIYNAYEAPPPSYAAVIDNDPPKYTSEPSAPSSSATPTAETTSLRV